MVRLWFTRYPDAIGIARYTIAASVVLVALLLKLLLNPLILGDSPFLIFFAAVTFSAWYGGLGPGLMATVLATGFSAVFFLSPVFSLSVAGLGNQAQLGLFLIEGWIISALSDALRTARRTAEAAVRTRDHFLAIAAHELKTPLTSVIGYTQVLNNRISLKGDLPDRERQIVQSIDSQARRLHQLIESLLDLSRIQTGRLSIQRQALDIVQLARRVVDEIRLTLEQHTIVLQAPKEPLTIDGDELRLEQVLQNLLQNAIKYSPDGGEIRVTVEACDHQACIAVSDQGIGIPDSARDQVFQRYYRAGNIDPQRMNGMGIGLYVVQEIVSLHAGTVQLTSNGSSGSTFTVCLPRRPSERAHERQSAC
jgi:signal transduction histidine kinase